MLKNNIVITINGNDINVVNDTMWSQYFYADVTGKDPLKPVQISGLKEIFDELTARLYAGAKAGYKKVNKKEDFTFEDVQNFVGAMSFEECRGFLDRIVYKEIEGELEPQMNGASEVAVGTS